ncbi:MAG: hypothetical protein R3Y58_09790 [Eubacteriales bacterium]
MKNNKNSNHKEESPVIDITIGIIVVSLVIQIAVLFFSATRLYHTLGLWIGSAMAVGVIFHMLRSVEDAIDIGEYGASAHMKKKTGLRSIVVLGVLGIIGYFQLASLLTAFIGIMTLKISVYLQPYIYKVRTNLRKGG